MRQAMLWWNLLNLRSPNRRARVHAAGRLATFPKSRRALVAVVRALADSDLGVRSAAGRSLRIIGPYQIRRVMEFIRKGTIDESRALEALIDLIQEKDALCRSAAAEGLAAFAEHRASAALIGALNDPVTFVRIEAVRALRYRRNKEAAEPLRSVLADKDKLVAQEAGWALSDLGDNRAVPFLLCTLADGDEKVRSQALSCLVSLCGTNWIRSEAVQSAVPFIATELNNMKVEATTTRENSGRSPEYRKSAIGIDNRRRLLVELLGEIGAPSGTEAILEAIATGSERVQTAARRALTRLTDPRAVHQLVAILESTDVTLRHEAADALIRINDGAAARALALSLTVSNGDVNRLALASLEKIIGWEAFDEVLDCVPTLVNSLSRANTGDRTVVLKALSRIKHAAIFPAFLAEDRFDARNTEALIINCLCEILMKSAATISEPDLKAASRLRILASQGSVKSGVTSGDIDINYYSGAETGFRSVDCSAVHCLARQELGRRGISDSV